MSRMSIWCGWSPPLAPLHSLNPSLEAMFVAGGGGGGGGGLRSGLQTFD